MKYVTALLFSCEPYDSLKRSCRAIVLFHHEEELMPQDFSREQEETTDNISLIFCINWPKKPLIKWFLNQILCAWIIRIT